ncbi:unnamed protein product, partial [Trichobilharzia regenti]
MLSSSALGFSILLSCNSDRGRKRPRKLVSTIFADCDEIIMRHKEACLRITCLTVCKDLLWAGTSAGVIVTLVLVLHMKMLNNH